MRRLGAALLMMCLSGGPSHALDAEQQHGKELLQKMCARCHAVGTTGASPNSLAPPFRTLGENKLYDNDFLQRLQEGYSTIHRFMPTFRFTREDAEAVVNYLKAIQTRRTPN
jgi:mono/diheme cytochrome c family protein